ncbi:modification methylase SalI (adenine-specific methyltransferase SalI) (M.SalI) [Hapalosiphon sp. MRB220]|nr:modification methylase SalI (adenine-specific methyltransferase SalI) (M.SalI) [Hapalosiphon sp. MRB220]
MNITKASEQARVLLQLQLDEAKTQIERNKLGQFATPTHLASDILKYAFELFPAHLNIRFLDPAFGTGSFYSALLREFTLSQIAQAIGYEIDPHYGSKAISLWRNTPLKLNITDFTQVTPPQTDEQKANLIICNPPYVRHHHLSRVEKQRLQNKTLELTGIKFSQLASLYCHFLCIADAWMADNCLAGWLIPSGFMDVNYGQQVKEYLLTKVTLLRVHRFHPNDVQFEDALCTSAVVWFLKALPPANHHVEFSYGGSLLTPHQRKLVSGELLRNTAKWTKIALVSNQINSHVKQFQLKDLFTIKRGLATGANNFFVLTLQQVAAYQIPIEFLKPILPSPRYLLVDEIETDSMGNPILQQQLFLLDCHLPFVEVKAHYPMLWQYLQIGVNNGISSRYLCKHRSPWYSQERRSPSPFLCTYMGRQDTKTGRPFRFILNHSQAIATNVYLMLYPKPVLASALSYHPQKIKLVWQALNKISDQMLMAEGRVYGGGLYKLEPKELGNVFASIPLSVHLK